MRRDELDAINDEARPSKSAMTERLFAITLKHPLGETKCFTAAATLPMAVAFVITGLAKANDWAHSEIRASDVSEYEGEVFLPARKVNSPFPDLYDRHDRQ